jgi:DNA-binding NarL/FixJ family response regulator
VSRAEALDPVALVEFLLRLELRRERPARRPGPPQPTSRSARHALVADGATNREVAARLLLSPRTVDHHLRNIFTGLGMRSRTERVKLLV